MIVNHLVKYSYSEELLNNVFATLSDPTRRSLFAMISKKEASVKELAKPFDMSLPAISKHLTVLEKAGLIARTRKGRQRICMVEETALEVANDWIQTQRKVWGERFDALDDHLEALQKEEKLRG